MILPNLNKQFPKQLLLLAPIFLFLSNSHAQETPEPVAKVASPKPATPADIAQVEALFGSGSYDEAIIKATPFIAAADKVEPRLLYFRGRAAFAIGSFGIALEDLSKIGNYNPYKTGKTAADYVQQIEEMRSLAPQNVYEVKDAGKVIFRVYYDQADEWTGAIIKLLPDAYNVNYSLLHKNIAETPVFIFSDYQRFLKFYSVKGNGTLPGSWAWAAGGGNGFFFCNNHPTNLGSRDSSGTYFKTTVVHEFNHCVVRRILGGVGIPKWLSEGLAVCAETTASSESLETHNRKLFKAFRANALLPLSTMTNSASFKDSVESKDATDAYAQSYSMADYLVSVISAKKVAPFLDEVRVEGSFDEVLLKYTGMSQEQFFEAWVTALRG